LEAGRLGSREAGRLGGREAKNINGTQIYTDAHRSKNFYKPNKDLC
jgi:hypothetical protein